MIDLSYFGDGADIVFYDSFRDLYFSRNFTVYSWDNDWDRSCYFDDIKWLNEFFNLLNDKVSEEGYGVFRIGMATNFKSVGLCNICVVPVERDWDSGDKVILFRDSVRLVDILSND